VDGLWATKSEGVGLIVRAIIFQDFQPMSSWSTNVTDGRTDRRTTCNRNTALCTIVHRAVKTNRLTMFLFFVVYLFYSFWSLCHCCPWCPMLNGLVFSFFP